MRNLMAGAAVVLGLMGAANAADDAELTARNRVIITKFANLFYTKHDVHDAFLAYVAPGYIQHNPGIADGRATAMAALTPMMATPGSRFEIKQILVDGNLAAIHLFGQGDLKTRGAAVVDIYRLDHGKIVEHWDVLQAMPTSSHNSHPMF